MKKFNLLKASLVLGFAAVVAVLPCQTMGQSSIKMAQAAEATEPTVAEVEFSAGSGVYATEFSLTLSAGSNTIYYTLDGSNPTTSTTRVQYSTSLTITDRKGDANVVSAVDPDLFDSANVTFNKTTEKFESKVNPPSNDAVDKATIVKAVAKDSAGNYSAVTTNTYFVGDMANHIEGIKNSCKASGMPLSIMSISMDKADLFDSTKGIYVHGDIFDKALEEYYANYSISSNSAVDVARSLDANYKQKGKAWERACHIDYLESDGTTTEVKLQQDCGIRIQGNYSRSDLQKGLRLYAREEYGQKKFKYAFFPGTGVNSAGEDINKFKKLTLRAGGNCAFTSKFNDAYWQSLIHELKCDTQASRVCVVYINGEYWGVYILQEDYDDNYFEETYGVNKDDVVIYKGDAEALELGYKIDEGTLPEGVTDESYFFQDLLNFFKNYKSLSKQKAYDEFCKLVDVESLRDYFAVQVWINNKWDWPGKNWSIWKTTVVDESNPYADGRWRFCFYDMDFGGVSGGGDAYTNTIQDDNYKPYGLLDMNTDNPVVLMFSYMMSHEGLRTDYINTLKGLSDKNFQKTAALAKLNEYKNTYKPLLDQFFARYDNISTTNNAINGNYATYASIKGFVEKRASGIQIIVDWVNDYYSNTYKVPADPIDSVSTGTNNGGAGDKVSNNAVKNAKKVISKLKVVAKKGKKTIKITTLKKSKVTIKINRKIIKKGKKKVKTITYTASKNKKGKLTIKLFGKLKKKDKITITVKKSGYKTKKKTIKIK